jgi:hypothetical protein
MKPIFNTLLKKSLILLILLPFSVITAFAQSTTVKGVITDAKRKDAMPYVTVSFNGTTQGVSTNTQGQYSLNNNNGYKQIKVSFIGYKTVVRDIDPTKDQVINIAMVEDNHKLNEVVVRSAKKKKYTNKNNPAVELIRQVIAHKKQNQLESYDYAEYRQYERMHFSLRTKGSLKTTSSCSVSRILQPLAVKHCCLCIWKKSYPKTITARHLSLRNR